MINVLILAVQMFTRLIYTIVFIRIIIGWIGFANRSNAIYVLLCDITDPILVPFRKIVQESPFNKAMFLVDFSPILALSCINLISIVIVQILMSL